MVQNNTSHNLRFFHSTHRARCVGWWACINLSIANYYRENFWTILPAGHLDHELYDVDVVMQVGWDTWQLDNIVEFCNFTAKFYYFRSYLRDALHSSYEPHKSSRINPTKSLETFSKWGHISLDLILFTFQVFILQNIPVIIEIEQFLGS